MRPSAQNFDTQTIRYYKALKKIKHFLSHHIFLIVATIGVWIFGVENFFNLSYLDGDGYMRALRLKHLILTPSFFEQPIYESNYPFGEILHWTRPMDIIWLLAMLPFLHLSLDLSDTIFISGFLIAPLLGILSGMALAYGLKRRFNIWLVLIGCILFFILPLNNGYFSPRKPDHHALMMLLTLYASSLVFCWLKKRQNRYLRLLGLSLALALFTVIDGIIIYLLYLSFFVYLWVFKNISLLPAVKISKYFALATTLFWFLNPPYEGWMYPDNGRLSILYVVISWLTFCGFWILDKSHLHTIKIKLLSILCIILAFMLGLITIFGLDIFTPPLDTEITVVWAKYIVETCNAFHYSFSYSIYYILAAFLSLVINFYMLSKNIHHRLMIFNLCLGLPLFILNLWAIRFAQYQILYTITPWLAFIEFLYKKTPYAKNKNLPFPISLWIICLVIIVLPRLCAIPYSYELKKINSIKKFSPQICQQIQKIGGTLLTDTFISIQYVYKCNVNTVGTSYHRNREGILDTHQALFSTSDTDVIPLILKHQITQILVFDNYDQDYYSPDKENKNKLYYRLIKRENIPPFLEEIPTSLKNARLYQVKI